MINKKGAIEFSMQTIIIIVIGVVVLSLGLLFVKKVFHNAPNIPAPDLPSGMWGEEAVMFRSNTIEVKQGDTDKAFFYVRNLGSDIANFKISASVLKKASPKLSDEKVLSWLTYNPKPFSLGSGKDRALTFLIDVPKGANLGTYMYDIQVDCEPANVCDEETYNTELILKVK